MPRQIAVDPNAPKRCQMFNRRENKFGVFTLSEAQINVKRGQGWKFISFTNDKKARDDYAPEKATLAAAPDDQNKCVVCGSIVAKELDTCPVCLSPGQGGSPIPVTSDSPAPVKTVEEDPPADPPVDPYACDVEGCDYVPSTTLDDKKRAAALHMHKLGKHRDREKDKTTEE